MLDDLIDDEVRRSFPGWDDAEIYEFYLAAKSAEEPDVPTIFSSDLSHAQIIRELGWEAFKEYLHVTTGSDELDDDDFVALTEAASFLREMDNTSLYSAMYSFASEMSSSKTAETRKKSFDGLIEPLTKFAIIKGI